MSLTPTQLRIDDTTEYTANTLLITVSNAPRAGAGLKLAAGARMDDGLLDVSVYQDLDQAALLARMLATLPDGWSDADTQPGLWYPPQESNLRHRFMRARL